jgi:hypothetical protein
MEKMTDIFTVGIVLAIAIYDIYVLWKDGVKSTISVRILNWSIKYPVIPFVFGFVMGHLFWSNCL